MLRDETLVLVFLRFDPEVAAMRIDEGGVVEAYLDGMLNANEPETRRASRPRTGVVGNEAAGLEWLSINDFVTGCTPLDHSPDAEAHAPGSPAW